MPCCDAAGTAEGSDGKSVNGARWSGGSGQGAQPQPRGDFQPSRYQPGRTAATPRGVCQFMDHEDTRSSFSVQSWLTHPIRHISPTDTDSFSS